MGMLCFGFYECHDSPNRHVPCRVSASYAMGLLENILAPVEHETSFKPEMSQHLCNMDLIAVHLSCVI